MIKTKKQNLINIRTKILLEQNYSIVYILFISNYIIYLRLNQGKGKSIRSSIKLFFK